MNPPSLPYHASLGPVNILDDSSARFSHPAKIHPACPESLFFLMPSGHPSKVKQSNRSGVGAICKSFLVLSKVALRCASRLNEIQ